MAAAGYAEGAEPDPPPMLVKAWRCQKWNALPRVGGLDDQPMAAMVQMESALNVYEAFKAATAADNTADFAEKHPGLAAVVVEVNQIRGLIPNG